MNRVVREISEMSIKGNLIDNGWYKHLRYENGKANLNAVVILGEIFYWYRACKKKNDKRGSEAKNNQKFKGDKLQKSYLALSEQFGLTKRQVKEACDFLKERGFITVEYRKVRLSDGRVMSNVMFFEPIVENIKKISCCYEMVDVDIEETESDNNQDRVNKQSVYKCNQVGVDKQLDNTLLKGNRCNCEEGQVVHLNVIGSPFKGGTYTESTTKSTHENTIYNYKSYQVEKEAAISVETVSNEKIRSERMREENGVQALSNYAFCKEIKEIVEYLNKKTRKNYKGFAKSTQKLIRAKVEEGYTKEDLYKVIDNKVLSWGGTAYEKYLRPTTLFGDKFDEYLNEEEKEYGEVREYKKSSFCDFSQRKYDGRDGGVDLHELEKKLLGW